jgi:hypothetical protein
MNRILIGRNDSISVWLDPRYGNRRGMIAGATGAEKSMSLMGLTTIETMGRQILHGALGSIFGGKR